MLINLKIEDHLYDHYLRSAGSPGHYRKMKEAIETFKDVKVGDRVLLLHGEGRQKIEAIFQTTLDTPEVLEKLIKNLCTVQIGETKVTLTPDHLARLASQAQFFGKTTEEMIQDTITELLQRFMEEW